MRTICRSKTYQLSSLPNEYNLKDKQNFSRYYPKRLKAEVLYDSLHQVTATTQGYNGLPAGTTAVQLPDPAIGPYFLKVFGQQTQYLGLGRAGEGRPARRSIDNAGLETPEKVVVPPRSDRAFVVALTGEHDGRLDKDINRVPQIGRIDDPPELEQIGDRARPDGELRSVVRARQIGARGSLRHDLPNLPGTRHDEP